MLQIEKFISVRRGSLSLPNIFNGLKNKNLFSNGNMNPRRSGLKKSEGEQEAICLILKFLDMMGHTIGLKLRGFLTEKASPRSSASENIIQMKS